MAEQILTQAFVVDLLDYNPKTGIMYWKKSNSNWIKVGDVAGNYSKTTGYINIGIGNKTYAIHRIIWLHQTGSFPESCIDHINRIRTDNRFCNLRTATKKQNAENTSIRKDNVSGHKGVSWHKKSKKWLAQMQHNGQYVYLGLHKNIDDASRIVADKRKELFTYESTK